MFFAFLFAYCFDVASPTLHSYLHPARGPVNRARKGVLSNLLTFGAATRLKTPQFFSRSSFSLWLGRLDYSHTVMSITCDSTGVRSTSERFEG